MKLWYLKIIIIVKYFFFKMENIFCVVIGIWCVFYGGDGLFYGCIFF